MSSWEYSSQKSYAANYVNGEGCTEYGSFPNSKAVDTENALETFYAQSWSFLALKLPEYAELLNSQTAYLTASPRIELTASCSSMSIDSLIIGASGVEEISLLGFIFGMVAIIGVYVPGIFICLFSRCFSCSRDSDRPYIFGPMGKKAEEDRRLRRGCTIGLYSTYPSIAVILIIAPALIGSKLSAFEPFYDDYEFITQNSCFVDDTVQSTVQVLIDSTGTAKTLYHLLIGLVVPYWVLFIVWIYLCYKKYRT